MGCHHTRLRPSRRGLATTSFLGVVLLAAAWFTPWAWHLSSAGWALLAVCAGRALLTTVSTSRPRRVPQFQRAAETSSG